MSASSRYISPLRYPGGKASWLPMLRPLADEGREVWFEPFAGGLGAGLGLLAEGTVDELWFCEAHPALAAFWQAVIDSPAVLAERLERTELDLDTFYRARAVVGGEPGDDDMPSWLAALVVNRGSFSGVIAPNVGPIGGKAQTGRWRVDARWNAAALAQRIRRLGELAPRMTMIGHDALSALDEIGSSGVSDAVVVFIDPPYTDVGERLYVHGMNSPSLHARLAATLSGAEFDWIATYDDSPLVHELYGAGHLEVRTVPVMHRANRVHADTELLIAPRGLLEVMAS